MMIAQRNHTSATRITGKAPLLPEGVKMQI